MPKRRRPAQADAEAPADPELAEFAELEPLPPADPAFRERLRAELWELLNEGAPTRRSRRPRGAPPR
jgi:hypothetical protein